MYKVYRDEPKCSVYLDIKERQDTYNRHTLRLVEIEAHRAVVDSSHLPSVPRLEVYEVRRARNRLFQLRVNAENTRAVSDIGRTRERNQIAVRKSAPPPRAAAYTWTAQLRECERPKEPSPRGAAASKFMFAEQRSRPSTASSTRVIQVDGMTVEDKSPKQPAPVVIPGRAGRRKVRKGSSTGESPRSKLAPRESLGPLEQPPAEHAAPVRARAERPEGSSAIAIAAAGDSMTMSRTAAEAKPARGAGSAETEAHEGPAHEEGAFSQGPLEAEIVTGNFESLLEPLVVPGPHQDSREEEKEERTAAAEIASEAGLSFDAEETGSKTADEADGTDRAAEARVEPEMPEELEAEAALSKAAEAPADGEADSTATNEIGGDESETAGAILPEESEPAEALAFARAFDLRADLATSNPAADESDAAGVTFDAEPEPEPEPEFELPGDQENATEPPADEGAPAAPEGDGSEEPADRELLPEPEETAAPSESADIAPSDQSEPSETGAPPDGILAIGNEAPNQGQTEAGELLPDLICAALGGGETTAKMEAEAEVMPRELVPELTPADNRTAETEMDPEMPEKLEADAALLEAAEAPADAEAESTAAEEIGGDESEPADAILPEESEPAEALAFARASDLRADLATSNPAADESDAAGVTFDAEPAAEPAGDRKNAAEPPADEGAIATPKGPADREPLPEPEILAEATAAPSKSADIAPSDQSEPSETGAPPDGILAIGNEAPNQGQTEAGELLPDLICATLAGGETTAKMEAEAEVMPRELAPTPGSTDDAAPAPEPEAEPEGKAESSVDAEAAAMTEANREPSAESAVEALAATDAAEVPPEKAVRPDEDPPEWSDAASAVLPEENATDEHAEPPAGDSIIDSTYRPLGPAPPTDADTPVDWETPPAPEAAPEETAVAPEAELESAVDLPGPELLAEEVTVADVGEMAVAAEFEPEEAALGQDSAESSTIPAEKDLTVLAPPEKDPGSAEEPGEQAPVPAALLLPAEEAPTEAVDSTTERKLESAPMPERTEPIEPKPEELDTADGEDRLPLAEDSATDGNAASLKLEALPAGSDPQPGTDLGTADDDGDIGEQPAESSSVSRLLAANDEQALQEYTNLPIDEEPEEVSDIPIEDCDAGA